MNLPDVIPTNTGIHSSLILLMCVFWTPASAGVTVTFHTVSYAMSQVFKTSGAIKKPLRPTGLWDS